MKKFPMTLLVAGALACGSTGLALADAPPVPKGSDTSAWSEGGLESITVKGLDVVYFRPGASLVEYTRIKLGPISVAFRKDWARTVSENSRTRVRPDDMQRIKDKLAALIREEVGKELAKGGYELVDTSAADVLAVDLAIIDLNVRAPDLAMAGRTNIYAVSAGEMSMVATLSDTATGDTIARVFDHAKAREWIRARRIPSIDNANEARDAAGDWARALREQLDLARKIPRDS